MVAAGGRGESGENEVRDPMETLAKNPGAREIGGSLCRVLEIRIWNWGLS